MPIVPYPDLPVSVKSFPFENELDERMLLKLLNTLQEKLLARRGRKTTLVVHGGVIEVLALKCRRYTSDIDYIERVLPEDLEAGSPFSWYSAVKDVFLSKFPQRDTADIIRDCIFETASAVNADLQKSCIGYEWMNPGGDIFLPWRLE